MIGGPGIGHYISKQHALNEKMHEEYAKAMSKVVLEPYHYPVAYTIAEGDHWRVPCSVKFNDGSIYDTKTNSWRPEKRDPIGEWENVSAGDPLMSERTRKAGEALQDEVKKLREEVAKLREVEDFAKNLQRRGFSDSDDEGDF